LFNKGKQIELKQQTKAESDIAVAAASILARADFVTRIQKLGQDIGIPLPKGASKATLEIAAKIINQLGANKLNTLAKTHFKTLHKAMEYSK
jgi:ribonuclease HIII